MPRSGMEGVPDNVKVSGLKCNQAGSGLPATAAGFDGNEAIHHFALPQIE